MTFKTVPVVVAGPSYMSRSRPLSSQSTVNFYQEFSESGKSPVALHSWPGQKLVGSGGGADRGQHVMANIRYKVASGILFEIRRDGSHINRGYIPGASRCIFANDGINMYIVNSDGAGVFQYSTDTNLVTQVTDPDISGSVAVAFLNNQFIYSKPNLFIISDVGNGASASGLNAAQAESQPDDLVRAYVFDQLVYMFGENTIEPWYNIGTGAPPFDRIDTQIIQVGTAATHSIANNDNFLYWLGDDRQVYQGSGGQARIISSIAISHAIEGYTTVSDAIGWTMTFEGQNFYILTFPTENKTWAINESLGKDGWFELSSDHLLGKYNATSYSYLDGRHFVANETNGELYELDIDTFDANGDELQRIRVMSSIHGGLFGVPGRRIQMSRFELILETGVGTATGQGEDPKIMIEASYDGGRSFGPGTWMEIGRAGETQIRAEWFDMSSFYDLIIRITATDPVPYSMQSGVIDVRLLGNGKAR
jgi:hypothetical protein